MNSTRWCTLTGFVNFLGREGICKVDQTEKGWFIAYINRDPDFLERERKKAARKKMDMDDDEIQAKMIEEQIRRGAERAPVKDEIQPTELIRESNEEKIKVDLAPPSVIEEKKPIVVAPVFLKEEDVKSNKNNEIKKATKRKTALDEIMEQEESRKEKQKRKENWLHENIIVKIITKKLGAQYNGKKGVITVNILILSFNPTFRDFFSFYRILFLRYLRT